MDWKEWGWRYYEWTNEKGVYNVRIHPGYCIVVYKLLQRELKLGHEPCLHYTRLICKHLAQMLIPTPDVCDRVRCRVDYQVDLHTPGIVYQHWLCHRPCLVHHNRIPCFAKGYCCIKKNDR